MKAIAKIGERLKGLTNAICRFPLTTLFLLTAVIINAVSIQTENDYSNLLITLIVGAFLSAVSQVAYERFFVKHSTRYLLMALVILLTAGYYLIIRGGPDLSLEITLRTAIALFALLFAFIWVPVIRSIISFNKSFMIAFKSFFNSVFFSGVIYIGMAIIITAIDQLIFPVEYHFYLHAANLIFVLFTPMYFLSLIPKYLGASVTDSKRQEEIVNEAASCPKFLAVLISYILIPLVSIFTLILLVYIIQNIGGEFWNDNLLEPMLVTYSITVIVLYILSSEIENKFTALFRKIFPKVLIPIVVFQIISSVLSLADTGITHTRYYVILFGIFAAVSGVLLSFLPVRKNGVIAALLIVFSLISIIPPVDAFSVSRASQVQLMEEILVENGMLNNHTITPNGDISNHDKARITKAMSYLDRMDYTEDIEWLPKDFDYYQDFTNIFGFSEYYEQGRGQYEYVYVGLNPLSPITVSGYDTFLYVNLYGVDQDQTIIDFEKEGKKYSLVKEIVDTHFVLTLKDQGGNELLSYSTEEIMAHFYNFESSKDQISSEEATFTTENDRAALKLVVQSLNIDKSVDKVQTAMDAYMFITIK